MLFRLPFEVPKALKEEAKVVEKENEVSMLAQLHAEKLKRQQATVLERQKEVQKAQNATWRPENESDLHG